MKCYLKPKMKTIIQTRTMNIVFFPILSGFPPPVYITSFLIPFSWKWIAQLSAFIEKSCKTVLKGLQTFVHSFIHSFSLPDQNRISFPVLAEPCCSQRSCKRSLSLLILRRDSSSQFLEKIRRFLMISVSFLELSCCFLFFKWSGQGDVLAEGNAK